HCSSKIGMRLFPAFMFLKTYDDSLRIEKITENQQYPNPQTQPGIYTPVKKRNNQQVKLFIPQKSDPLKNWGQRSKPTLQVLNKIKFT
ncbi:hypothetical protein, partial [Bellilinea sp.]|uniref:hypothetical protein n=1 Tax=Bellilinea sp. TaxID=2838785 RepID=UPI002ADE3095